VPTVGRSAKALGVVELPAMGQAGSRMHVAGLRQACCSNARVLRPSMCTGIPHTQLMCALLLLSLLSLHTYIRRQGH
jgi:hypothetical protein